MKNRIEVVANLVVIAFAVIVGSIFIRDRLCLPVPHNPTWSRLAIS